MEEKHFESHCYLNPHRAGFKNQIYVRSSYDFHVELSISTLIINQQMHLHKI